MFQYICENHFQRLSKTSMFTGLKAINHFGRPDMSSFLKFVQKKHSYVSTRLCSANFLEIEVSFIDTTTRKIVYHFIGVIFAGKQDRGVQLRPSTSHKKHYDRLRRSQQRPKAPLLHTPFRKFRLKFARTSASRMVVIDSSTNRRELFSQER